jgi:hypothetical protein
MPRNAFADIDVSTVDRSVKRSFPDQAGRAPFDLATHEICSLSAGTQETLIAVYAAVEQSFRETDDMAVTLRLFLRANVEEACKEKGLLATILVQAAACAHLEHPNPATAGQDEAAQEVVSMRKALIEEMIRGHSADLTIALRRLRRRPREPFAMRDIVLSVIASSDGTVLLHKLDPGLISADLVVETQWDIIVGLTEPGLLDPRTGQLPNQRALVEAAMGEFASGRIPSLDDLVGRTDASDTSAVNVFIVDTPAAIAQGCMECVVGSAVETHAIAVGVRGAELSAVRDLLIAITLQSDATPEMTELVRHDREAGFRAAARRNVATAIAQASSRELDPAAADAITSMVIEAALLGTPGRATWETGLEVVTRPS